VAPTDEAIAKIRGLIQSGSLPPGSRLPPEPQLAAQMGLSRSGVREAVKVLEAACVLDVRRGDGTYVTSLAPRLLLEGLGLAVERLRDERYLQRGDRGHCIGRLGATRGNTHHTAMPKWRDYSPTSTTRATR